MNANVSNDNGLASLEAAVARELELLDYPRREWMTPRTASDGRKILDVLIIGGGQSGLAIAFGLLRDRVSNILVIDENPEGREGPWMTFARMKTLRTPKHVIGPDLGVPSLTVRAWYEAIHGNGSWESVRLLPKDQWAGYLSWLRRLLKLPVRNEVNAGAIEWNPTENCFNVPVVSAAGAETILARKIVLATGIDGSGRWATPPEIAGRLPKSLYAHTHDPIDFGSLIGKRVGVLGAGASAFDNASVALETGAGEVHLFFRRPEMVCVNPYRWSEFVGFLRHHSDLPDADRWKFILQIYRMGQLPPSDTFERACKHANFHLHPGSPLLATEPHGSGLRLTTPNGSFDLDYLIIGTGFVTDLSARPELAMVHSQVALWSDRYSPAPSETHVDLLRHPFLGANFELQEKTPGSAPWLSSIFNFTFGAVLSHGFSGASISGMKFSIPRLIAGITKQLYIDDLDRHFDSLVRYDIREF